MKTLLSILFTISFSINSIAQSQCDIPEEFTGNTGANMTIMLVPDFINSLPITSENSYLVAYNSNGQIVGSTNVSNLSQTTLAVWGNDSSTNLIDGAIANETISFQLVDGNNIYDIDMITSINYTTNGLVVQGLPGIITPFCIYGCTSDWSENFNNQATDDDGTCYLNGCTDVDACNYTVNATIDNGSCTIPGCTDNSYTEYYHQGYVAGCDDGSCSKATSDLGLNSSYFVNPNNTGSNMTLGINLINTTGLEGSIIAAFSDLNNDGLTTECVGLSEFQEGFFSMALWGNDSSTDEVDGLLANEIEVIFAVLNSSGNVMAFNTDPEFTGYSTNGLLVINNLDFNVTIYGCMDSNYCNFNPEAEEDDSSCLGTPGCIDANFIEYNSTASCSLDEACIITWESAYINELEISTQLGANLDIANQNTLTVQNELDATTAAANQADIDATNLLNSTIAESNELELDYINQIEVLSEPILIDIKEGWNILGYTRSNSQDVVATFNDIADNIAIVKNNDAEVYWPEFGFNGIGDLIPGQGYQLKTNIEINDYFYPNTENERIIINATVPQWVIDMPADIHPNDIRTLVKVVNLLGQEVNPRDCSKGTTLIYLYNDASVEKKIN